MEIQTKRLLLREFKRGDVEPLLAYQNDPRYLHYDAWSEQTEEVVEKLVQLFIDQQAQRQRFKFQLVITLKSTRKVIGNCGVRKKTPEVKDGDLGYELDPNYWGHGYALEAARAMLSFGFTQLKLDRISAWCIAENARSVSVLQKLHMREESYESAQEFFKSRWWDKVTFGLTAEEWRDKTCRISRQDQMSR